MIKKENFFIFLIFVIALTIYYPSLNNFFFQDDFRLLFETKTANLLEFLRLFLPLPGRIYYRPLSMQFFFWFSQLVFDRNPFGFHLISFLFHLANIYLVLTLSKMIIKKGVTPILIAFLYGINASHFLALFWICEFSLILSSFFFFLSFIFYLKSKERRKYYFHFLLFFFLAAISNELTFSLPAVLFFYELFLNKKFKKQGLSIFKELIPCLLIVLTLIFLRFLIFPTSLGTSYQPNLAPIELLRTFRWYLFRVFSLPEGIKNYLFQNSLALISLAGAIFFIIIFFVTPLFLVETKKLITNRWNIFFGFFWFTTSLLPIAFFVSHRSASYVVIGLPGIFLALSQLFSSWWEKLKNQLTKTIMLTLVILIFPIASFSSVRLMEKTSWLTKRAKVAQKNLSFIQKNYLTFEKETSIFFKDTVPNSSLELYFAFDGPHALRVFYDNPNLEVLYEAFDEFPEDKENVYFILAK